MVRILASAAAGLLVVTAAPPAAEVWRSNFDSDADGVVDVFNNNLGKVMIGPAAAGRLQIEAWDNSTNAYTPDKAGRPLGATAGGADSFSGLYQFNWSTLNTAEAQAYELAGFIGTTASPQTRQVCGTILRHWKAGADNYVAMDIAFGTVGITGFGYLAGPAVWIGTDPTANWYQLAIGYDAGTHVLDIGLYDDQGNLVGGNTADLDTDVPGLQQYGTPAQEIGALAVDHLGWSDYTGNGGDKATIWQMDSLAYFDTATGAVGALVPEPTTLLLLAGGCAIAASRRR